jgi:class 3 adenylate cyclase
VEPPEIEYVRTSDGVDIAYATLGRGRPIVLMPEYSLAWTMVCEIPEWIPFFERLAENYRLVLIDPRGSGNSDLSRYPDHPDKVLRDVEAVIERLAVANAVLVARTPSAPFAMKLVVERPGTFTDLVLVHPILRYGDLLERGFSRVNRASVETSYDFWLDSIVVATAGDLSEPSQRRLRDIARTTPREAMLALFAAYAGVDGGKYAPMVKVRALVIEKERSLQLVPAEWVRETVAAIPGARLVRVREGGFPICDDPAGETQRALERFLGEPTSEARPHSAFRTILFTDVVSSTPLLTQLRDQRMREVMRDHDAVMEAAVTGHGGRVVKTIGDAFMAEFAVPSAAVEAAIEAQRQIREKFAASDVPVRLRIGINAGEPIEEAGDLHGASVVIAKRLESAAETNGILVSDVVKQMVTGKDFDFEDRGLVELKGFEEPVRAWTVRWE